MALGQTFTIEPILTLGGRKHRTWPDGWTVLTADGSLTAQFEHTVLVTEGGVEVLTRAPASQELSEVQHERRQHQCSADAVR
jgi:methionyl aminopeptidase